MCFIVVGCFCNVVHIWYWIWYPFAAWTLSLRPSSSVNANVEVHLLRSDSFLACRRQKNRSTYSFESLVQFSNNQRLSVKVQIKTGMPTPSSHFIVILDLKVRKSSTKRSGLAHVLYRDCLVFHVDMILVSFPSLSVHQGDNSVWTPRVRRQFLDVSGIDLGGTRLRKVLWPCQEASWFKKEALYPCPRTFFFIMFLQFGSLTINYWKDLKGFFPLPKTTLKDNGAQTATPQDRAASQATGHGQRCLVRNANEPVAEITDLSLQHLEKGKEAWASNLTSCYQWLRSAQADGIDIDIVKVNTNMLLPSTYSVSLVTCLGPAAVKGNFGVENSRVGKDNRSSSPQSRGLRVQAGQLPALEHQGCGS